MSDSTHLKAWVSSDTKERFAAIARAQGLSESALLKRMVELMIQMTTAAVPPIATRESNAARDARLYVRLRGEDFVLLRERSQGRGLAAATYASMVLRTHLRHVTPLPDRELTALQQSVAAMGTIGRNLNQLARAANTSGSVGAQVGTELRALLRALGALRDHVKGLVKANLESWETGSAEETNR